MSDSKQVTSHTAKPPAARVKSLLAEESVKKSFVEVLGEKAPAFMSSIVSAVSNNPALQKCEPMSVIMSAAISASLDLPINSSLGFAHIVPYRDIAQFQIGWKGFIQLALRSGQYKTINATPVFEGEISMNNRITGEMAFTGEKTSEKVVGYVLYFKLLNGYEKYFYMTREECDKHGKKYSASYKKGFGQWQDNFDAMALKTVVKLGLSKYGVLSIQMQKAVETDEGQIVDGEVVAYPDRAEEEKAPAKPKQSRMQKIVEEHKTITPPEPVEVEKEFQVSDADDSGIPI